MATLGYAVQAVCALTYGKSRTGGRVRAFGGLCGGMIVASQALAAVAILGLAYADSAVDFAILLSLAGAATRPCRSSLRDRARIARTRAAGTWVGVQNALGNLSGIFGPIITGVIVDRAGYGSAFVLTAAVAAFGALWWAVGVPKIEPVDFTPN